MKLKNLNKESPIESESELEDIYYKGSNFKKYENIVENEEIQICYIKRFRNFNLSKTRLSRIWKKKFLQIIYLSLKFSWAMKKIIRYKKFINLKPKYANIINDYVFNYEDVKEFYNKIFIKNSKVQNTGRIRSKTVFLNKISKMKRKQLEIKKSG